MAKPAFIEFHEDNQRQNKFEEHSEVPVGKPKQIFLSVTSADNAANRRTGSIVRLFSKVDGIPMATILILANEDNANQQVNKDVTVRPLRATQSLQVIAWDRKALQAGGAAGPAEIQARRRRFRGR